MKKNALALTISARTKELLKEKNTSLTEFRKEFVKELNKSGQNLTLDTIFRWFRGGTVPNVGGIIILAKMLNTSVGYLIKEHDLQDIKVVKNPSFDGNIKRVVYDYIKEEGLTRYPERYFNLSSSWFNKYCRISCISARLNEFVRLSHVTGVSIDYCLGVSDIKYWQEYALSSGQYDKLPGNTLFCFPGKGAEPYSVGILSEDKASIIMPSGMFLPIELAESRGAVLVNSRQATNVQINGDGKSVMPHIILPLTQE